MDSVDVVLHDANVYVGEAHILKDVYGGAKPGQLMAVMGPSGAGKTTLLNALSGRTPLNSGEITLNGKQLSKDLRRKICYVRQDDVFFPTLTLRETLSFCAMMRLPEEMSSEKKLHKLDTLIDDLELRKCLNTPMGGAWMPGLSGGERKRASIACDLITDPTIILLDEATSGLDYKTAYQLVHMLKKYAVSNLKTVVMTIHQPASQIFLMFDLLLLMCDGHTVYYGPPACVTEFYSGAGYPMASHYNPADFILEKMKESSKIKETLIQASYNTRRLGPSSVEDKVEDNVDQQRSWNVLSWNNSDHCNHGDTMLNHTESLNTYNTLLDVEATNLTDSDRIKKWPVGFTTQYKHLTMRALQLSRSRLLDRSKLFEAVFMGVVLSLLWFQLPRSESTLRDRLGLMFYISMFWGFTPLFEAVTTYPQEKCVIHKERASGWYRLSAYYLARLTSELPVIFLQPLTWLTVVYFVTGLNSLPAFLATVGTLLVHALTGQSVGVCIGIVCSDLRRGISFSTVIIMIVMLLGGFYTRNLPFWLDWAKYLVFLYYTFHCVLILEFTNAKDLTCLELTDTSKSSFPSCISSNGTVPTIPSQEVLEHFGIERPFWQYFLPLLAFLVLFRLLGYILLRFYQKPK